MHGQGSPDRFERRGRYGSQESVKSSVLPAPAAPFAYISNQDSSGVTVIDLVSKGNDRIFNAVSQA